MKDHKPGCPRLQFWDADEFDVPCLCDEEEIVTITVDIDDNTLKLINIAILKQGLELTEERISAFVTTAVYAMFNKEKIDD